MSEPLQTKIDTLVKQFMEHAKVCQDEDAARKLVLQVVKAAVQAGYEYGVQFEHQRHISEDCFGG